MDLLKSLKSRNFKVSDSSVQEFQGPEQIIRCIQAAINIQRKRSNPGVTPACGTALSQVEGCVDMLKDDKIITLEQLAEKIDDTTLKDLRVLAAALMKLNIMGKCLYYSGKGDQRSYVITDITWYMETLNRLYVQKYENLSLRNGSRWMALDPDVPIFTEKDMINLIPTCSNSDMRKLFLGLLLMQGVLCFVPRRSVLSEQSHEAHWFLFSHMKSSYLRNKPDQANRAGIKFKTLHWPDKGHQNFSSTDIEIEIQYRLTTSLSTDLLPRFLSECIQLGAIVVATKTSWITCCGAVEIMFKHNIKQVNVSSSFEIQARMTKFEPELQPYAQSVICQYMWSVLSQYLTVLDVVIADYPYMFSRVRQHLFDDKTGNGAQDKYFLGNGYTNGYQSLLPFHDFHKHPSSSTSLGSVKPYFNLPFDNSEDQVVSVCAHCGITEDAMIKLWTAESKLTPAFAGVAFDKLKDVNNVVCGSLVSSPVYTPESNDGQVVLVCNEPLYLTGVNDIFITVIKEGTIKLVIGERNYFTKVFPDDPDLTKCRMIFDLGSGLFTIKEELNNNDIKTSDLGDYVCRAGDTIRLHVTNSRLKDRADKTKTLMLEVELFRNGSKFCTCYVSYRSAIGVILEPSTEQTPSIVLQAPSYPMVSSRHFPVNTLLLYRMKDSQSWAVGHVVSHTNGYICVSSGDSKDSTKLMPGSSDILPISSFADGLTVLINKELLKSRDQLRNYMRQYSVEPAPVSLFRTMTASSGAKIFKHEPRMCLMNVHSPFVLDMKYKVSDTAKKHKSEYTHVYLPRNMVDVSVLHPNRQIVQRWDEQNIHIMCSGSQQFEDMHFMDAAPIEATFDEISVIQTAYLETVINCYHSLLAKQRDILPFLENIFPLLKDLPKEEVVRGIRVLLQLYKNTLTVARHLAEKKQFFSKSGNLKSIHRRATGYISKLYKERSDAFAEGDPVLCKCENHVVQTLDDNLLNVGFSSLKYASCVNIMSVELMVQPPEIAVVWDALANFPNLQHLTIVNASSLEGISRCRRLASLSATGGSYTSLPDDFIELKDTLTILDLSATPVTELPDFITEFHKLTQLIMKNTLLRKLPEHVGNLKNLEKLDVGHSLICSLPESFGRLTKLNHLSLNGPVWKILKQLRNVPQELTLNDLLHKIVPLIPFELSLKTMLTPEKWEEFFNKTDVNEQKLLSSEQWDSFNGEIFNFFPRFGSNCSEGNGEEYGGFPSVLFKCRNLRVLTINNQGLRFVPDEIKRLPLLQVVSLSNSPHLVSVSIELGKAPIRLLDVTGCPNLKTPPKEIVEKGKKTVIAYLRRLSQGSVKISRTKLMFVGLGGVGKTSLMRALISKDYKAPYTEGEAITDGIDITTWCPTDSLTYSVWDFAGQTVYYNTHQFFMSQRAVYILVWNTRLGYQHSGLEFWMSSIACHCPDSPVFVVGTHADQITNHELPQNNLAKRFPNIRGFHVVSSHTGEGVKELSDELQRITLDLPYMGGYIPEAWLNYEKAILEKRSEQSLLDWTKVEQIGNMCGIYGEEVKQAVIFLNDLGVLQYFNNRFLCDRVVINPQWIVDVMASVVSVHSSVIQNGRLRHSDIKVIWKHYPQQLHDWLLRLTEVFDLTFPVEDREENIVPCLLPSDEPAFDWPDVEHNDSITETKMIYKFDYLPAGLFNRIQVRLYQFSDDSSIWRTGSLLLKNYHHCLLKQTAELTLLVKACGHCPENIVLLVHEVIEELIAEFFTGIKYEYQIPCSGCIKMGTTDPAMFSSVVLRRAIDMKTYFLQCHTFFHTLSLTELQSIIPPNSGGDFEIQMQNAVRDLTDLEETVRADVFFLLSKQNVPSLDDKDTVHPKQIKDDLEKHNISWCISFSLSTSSYKHFCHSWYEEDLSCRKPEELDVAMRTAKHILVFMSDEFVEDPICQSLLLHVINRMQKEYILLMVGKERKWMTSAVGALVTGKVFVNFQRVHQYNEKIQTLIKAINEKLGRNSGTKYAPADVFLSYCWTNSEEAIKCGHAQPKEGSIGHGDPRKIKSLLENHQLSCWIDYERVGRVGLFHDIAEGMKQAKAVVAFVSDEYVISDNCQMEFRFAHIALKKPIVLAVVGTGYKWDATEIGMLALGYPKINFQVRNKMAYEDLLTTVQELVSKEKEKEVSTQQIEKNGNMQEKRSPKEKAFQEVYEMAQRKFLRQIANFNQGDDPFPRLFVVDFNYSSRAENEADKDTDTEEMSPDTSGTKPTFVVDELRSGQFCMKLLCEYETQWHATDISYSIEIAGKDLVQVWEFVAPFMARLLSLLKHSNINLHMLGTKEGEKLIKLMEQKAGLEYHTMIKPVYQLLKKYMQMKDRNNEKGGLKCCHLPSGKYLWLCEEHQKLSYVTVIEDDTQSYEITDALSPEDMLLRAVRDLTNKWRRENTKTQIKGNTKWNGPSTGSSSPNAEEQSKTLSTASNKTNGAVLDSAAEDKLVQNSLDRKTLASGEIPLDSNHSKDNVPLSSETQRTGSKPAAKLTSDEKVKIIRRTSAQRMAALGHNGRAESSQTCVIL
ncbi:hypothetical protein LSH36_27g04002 [Paralvinella palmiformis]|uniref:non-specific serine/threonine protein kinase n=1 Tax=Paralvinella palmiformis TaxID=53620 RepID=A0AAD9NGI9_9ANNE|nr:hypothetical protein LSH36_27g04002 [Paralvinella palmiformis]